MSTRSSPKGYAKGDIHPATAGFDISEFSAFDQMGVHMCMHMYQSNIRAAGSICGVMSLCAQRAVFVCIGSPQSAIDRVVCGLTTDDIRMPSNDAALNCLNELLQGELPDMLVRLMIFCVLDNT